MPFLSSHFRYVLTTLSFSLVLTSFSVVSYGQNETSNLEIEEIIVGGKNFPIEDYLDCRVMNLMIKTFYNKNHFYERIKAFYNKVKFS